MVSQNETENHEKEEKFKLTKSLESKAVRRLRKWVKSEREKEREGGEISTGSTAFHESLRISDARGQITILTLASNDLVAFLSLIDNERKFIGRKEKRKEKKGKYSC